MSLLRVDNPPNPWHDTSVEWIGEPPKARLQVYFDHTREILSRNDSPDIPFTWSVNPYRGCFHGCAYCYARPTHEYLGFGAGTDFERRIVVKPEAPALLEKAFRRKGWTGELIAFSGNTDCYQPIEASYGLTRACLEVCLRYRNPVGLITKAPLVERDVELLAELHRAAYASVSLSIPFADAKHARALEPAVPPPERRFRAIRALADAGVPVGVNVAPLIPGLTDAQMVEVLERAAEAGATFAGTVMLRLPGPVAEVFAARVREALPQRADRILARVAEVRGGRINDPRFRSRMQGEGVYARTVMTLFRNTCRRLGLDRRPAVPEVSPFRRPPAAGDQLTLFG